MANGALRNGNKGPTINPGSFGQVPGRSIFYMIAGDDVRPGDLARIPNRKRDVLPMAKGHPLDQNFHDGDAMIAWRMEQPERSRFLNVMFYTPEIGAVSLGIHKALWTAMETVFDNCMSEAPKEMKRQRQGEYEISHAFLDLESAQKLLKDPPTPESPRELKVHVIFVEKESDRV